jgi:hypothetical protein
VVEEAGLKNPCYRAELAGSNPASPIKTILTRGDLLMNSRQDIVVSSSDTVRITRVIKSDNEILIGRYSVFMATLFQHVFRKHMNNILYMNKDEVIELHRQLGSLLKKSSIAHRRTAHPPRTPDSRR